MKRPESVVALLTSLVSKDLVDIITGHQTGEIVKTFTIMIGLNVGTTFLNQISEYASTYLSLKVDSEIKADIFSKILVTDWESLTTYHTGDLLTRWGSDASAISNGILNFIPNAIIYVFRCFLCDICIPGYAGQPAALQNAFKPHGKQ